MVPASALPENLLGVASQGAGAVASLCHPQGYWTLQVRSESLSRGWNNNNNHHHYNNGTNIFAGRREGTVLYSLFSMGPLGIIPVLEICRIWRGSSCFLGCAPLKQGCFWEPGAMCKDVPSSERGCVCSGGAAGPAGLLSGTCFFLWLLRLSGVGGSDPLPTALPPSREWGWLSLAWKLHRFETISPPAVFFHGEEHRRHYYL